MKKTSPQITVRIGDELRARLDKACATSRLSPSQITQLCIAAFCDEFEKEGKITIPIRIACGQEDAPKKPPGAGSARRGGPDKKDFSRTTSASQSYRTVRPETEPLAAEEGADYSA